ncbi:MAG: hypothetical protein CMN57_06240 [Gammaproteobacteria bacterium]|nr:hypothetical protein [Gammaproteobacteria bacterium]
MLSVFSVAIHNKQTGFSLIELVMVIVILALASLAIGSQFMQSAQSWMLDERIQTASQLAQARAEQLLADRRLNDYSAVPAGTTTETLTGNFAGYTRTTLVSSYAGAACPVLDCRQVVITVTDADGQVRAETSLMVADY